MVRPDPKILERKIEAAFVKYAKTKGCKAYKFTSPANRSVPDRLVACPWGRLFFVEFKRPGAPVTPAQKIEHRELRERGHTVYVCDNFGQAEFALDQELVLAERNAKVIGNARAR